MYDVVIIGAGITGCVIARELSRYDLHVAVVDKAGDVAMGTTKANSAIVHAGYDAVPGTVKAEMNVAGNAMFDQLAKELDFPFLRNGSLVLGFEEDSEGKLLQLKKRGEENGVEGLRMLTDKEVKEMEPAVSDTVVAALFAPSGGIVCPYEMCISFAENAAANGVDFLFNQQVEKIFRNGDVLEVVTGRRIITTKLVVNAAGVFADDINNMISSRKITITPRSGQYFLLDRSIGQVVKHTLFQLPGALGKGVLVTPTMDDNMLIGPTAEDIGDKNDLTTNAEHYQELVDNAGLTLTHVLVRDKITSFTGLRAHCTENDFIIGEAPDVDNFINAAGIESPGLTSSPAIGKAIEAIVCEKLKPELKSEFVPTRHGIKKFRKMTNEERHEKIKEDFRYGRIVCRCETVSEGEIVESINRPVGARDIDGVKRRTRAGMGRCQGGFCSPTVLEILARELDLELNEVTKSGGKSVVLFEKNKRIEVSGNDTKY